MNIHTDRKIYSVPEGLNELLYDISKEVLRCKPKNLFHFISEFLINKLQVREAMKVAVPIIDTIETSGEASVDTLIKYNLSAEEGDRLATIVQSAYRGYRERKRLYHLRNEVGKVFNKADQVSAEVDFNNPLFEVLKTSGVSKQRMMEAAVQIQSFYRGHRVRKRQFEEGPERLVGVPSHESWRHDWLNEPLEQKELDESLPWRKSTTNFYNNIAKLSEGNRLCIETIYGGNYEDYNYVCDQTSCQDFSLPTVSEIRDLLPPGDMLSFTSEINELPTEEMKRTILEKMDLHASEEERGLIKDVPKSQGSASIVQFETGDFYEESPSELNEISHDNLSARLGSYAREDQMFSKSTMNEVTEEEDFKLFLSESRLVSATDDVSIKSSRRSSSKVNVPKKKSNSKSSVNNTNDVPTPELVIRGLSVASNFSKAEDTTQLTNNESSGGRSSIKRKSSNASNMVKSTTLITNESSGSRSSIKRKSSNASIMSERSVLDSRASVRTTISHQSDKSTRKKSNESEIN